MVIKNYVMFVLEGGESIELISRFQTHLSYSLFDLGQVMEVLCASVPFACETGMVVVSSTLLSSELMGAQGLSPCLASTSGSHKACVHRG